MIQRIILSFSCSVPSVQLSSTCRSAVLRPAHSWEASLIHFVNLSYGNWNSTTGIVWLGSLIDGAAKRPALRRDQEPLHINPVVCAALCAPGGPLLAGNGYLYLFFKYVPL